MTEAKISYTSDAQEDADFKAANLRAPENADVATSSTLPMDGFDMPARAVKEARQRAGWGANYRPSRDDAEYKDFKRICDELVEVSDELRTAPLEGEKLDAETSSGSMSDALDLLEELYKVKWGAGEALKAAVVIIQSQLNNASWTRGHVQFLRDAIGTLRSHFIIDEAIHKTIYDLIDENHLDPFRGTIGEPDVVYEVILKKAEPAS
jgi:hypothetical protein